MRRVNGSDLRFRPPAAKPLVAVFLPLALLAATWTGSVSAAIEPPSESDLTQLWEEPTDLHQRDLFHGPGGRSLMPDPSTPYTFVSEDRRCYSPGYDVRDPHSRLWDVKLGSEAQPEVVVSRLLWALGYHQPPTYYLSSWTMTGGRAGTQQPGRFRPELQGWNVVGDWSWDENPFVHAQPFKGLIVANLIVNNWDWKTSNNKIYEVQDSEGGSPARLYVVRDLGASLGKTTLPKPLRVLRVPPLLAFRQGTRNDLPGFESQGFIKRLEGESVEFHYRGVYDGMVDMVTRTDVVWTCQLMSRLADSQWDDAFRAAGYTESARRRFITKIKEKIDQGLKFATGHPAA